MQNNQSDICRFARSWLAHVKAADEKRKRRADDDETQQQADDVEENEDERDETDEQRRKRKKKRDDDTEEAETDTSDDRRDKEHTARVAQAASFIVRANERRLGSDVTDKPTHPGARLILAAMGKAHQKL